jgi:tetratricopeptide (TPR) repeat protein
MLIAALGVCLTYLAARRIAGHRIALIAAFALAWYPVALLFNTLLMNPVLVLPAYAAALLAALVAAERRKRWALLAGVVCGVALVARANLVIAVPVLAWTVASATRWRDGRITRIAMPGGQRLARAALYVAGVVIGLAPVVVRNAWVSAGPVVLSDGTVWERSPEFTPLGVTSGGISLRLGNNPQWRESIHWRDHPGFTEIFDSPKRDGHTRTKTEWDTYHSRVALNWIMENPGAFLQACGEKALMVLRADEIPRDHDVYDLAGESPYLATWLWKSRGFASPWGIACPLAIVGLVAIGRARAWRRWMPVIGLIALYSAGLCVTFSVDRYRLPIVPFVLMLAAMGAHALWTTRAAPLVIALAVGWLLTLGIGIGGIPVDEPSLNAETQYLRAIAASERGDMTQAEARINAALAIEPEQPRYVDFRANLLANSGRIDEARMLWEQASARTPGNAGAQYNLGVLDFRASSRLLSAAASSADLIAASRIRAEALSFRGQARAHLTDAIARNPQMIPARELLADLIDDPYQVREQYLAILDIDFAGAATLAERYEQRFGMVLFPPGHTPPPVPAVRMPPVTVPMGSVAIFALVGLAMVGAAGWFWRRVRSSGG